MSSAANMSVAAALAGCRRALWAVGLFSLAESVLMLVVPLYSFQMFDRVLSSRSMDTLLMLTLVAVGALVLLAVLDGVRAQLLARIGMSLEARLSGPVLAAGVAGNLRGDERGAQGLRDLALVRGFLSGPGMVALFDAPSVPVLMAVAYLITPCSAGSPSAAGWR